MATYHPKGCCAFFAGLDGHEMLARPKSWTYQTPGRPDTWKWEPAVTFRREGGSVMACQHLLRSEVCGINGRGVWGIRSVPFGSAFVAPGCRHLVREAFPVADCCVG